VLLLFLADGGFKMGFRFTMGLDDVAADDEDDDCGAGLAKPMLEDSELDAVTKGRPAVVEVTVVEVAAFDFLRFGVILGLDVFAGLVDVDVVDVARGAIKSRVVAVAVAVVTDSRGGWLEDAAALDRGGTAAGVAADSSAITLADGADWTETETETEGRPGPGPGLALDLLLLEVGFVPVLFNFNLTSAGTGP
jgi:hypothetical protein